MDIHELYTGNMRSTRTVGSEEEYPVVRKSDFHSLSREDIQKELEKKLKREVIMSLIADGWEEQRDHQTGRVSAVSKNVDGRPFKVTTDFGTGTLEVNYPVSQNLHEAEQDLRTNLSYLSKKLDENGFLKNGQRKNGFKNNGSKDTAKLNQKISDKVNSSKNSTEDVMEIEIPNGFKREKLVQLYQILNAYPGIVEVLLIIPDIKRTRKMKLPMRVEKCSELQDEIQKILTS